MVSSDLVRKKYDADAKTYHRMMYWFRYASTLQRLIEQIPINMHSDGRILELGCGTGIGTEVLLNRFPIEKIQGVDQSESMLRICHERFPQLSLVLGDFNQSDGYVTFPGKKSLVLQPSSYDVVFTTGAVSEYAELNSTIPFVYSLLKPGGKYVNIGIKRNLVGTLMGLVWKFNPAGKEKLTRLCEKEGFLIKELPISWKLFPTSYVKYVVIATKPDAA